MPSIEERPRRWVLRTGVLAFAFSFSFASTALAQNGRAADAERLFHEGRAAMDAGDVAAACPKFGESEKLDPAPGTLLSLADCEERSKAFVRAREHYQLAASGFAKKDPRRVFATTRAQALDGRIAHVTLRITPNTVVRLSGVTLDWEPDADLVVTDASVARAVDPGELHVTISAKGHADKVLTLTLSEGEAREVVCEPGPLDVTAPPPPPPARPPAAETTRDNPSPRRVVGFTLLGVGGASLVAGMITGILAAGKASTVKEHCTGDYLCDQEGVDAASAGQVLSTVSTITLIAGAALAGAGAYLAFVKPPTKRARASAPLRLVPFVGIRMDGASLHLAQAF